MRIEAVTVCVGYADLLREVAPYNRPLLDRWIVATTPEDSATRETCRAASLECVVTRDFRRGGAEFAKSLGIERGLAHTRGDGWLLHLDGDVALPADLHQVLDDAHLDEDCLYGCDRLNVVGAPAWDRVRARGLWCRRNVWAVHLDRPDTTLGTRVANVQHGYTPIGFFQLWHGPASSFGGSPAKRYPGQHGTAARTDVQHALQWDRRQRVLLPELLVWHLESAPSPMGANWRGRKSPPFRPAAAAIAAAEPARPYST